MDALSRHIFDWRSETAKPYWTAVAWKAVLDQDEFWVPRAAWVPYIVASMNGATLTDCVGERDGEPLLVGEAREALWFSANFDVAGIVRVAEMDTSWRANVVGFLWRRWSAKICRGLSFSLLHALDPFGEMPDFVADEISHADVEYMKLAGDADARLEWFNALPLIVRLRDSIVADRARRGPVLLGETPEPGPAPELIVATR